VVSLLCLLIGFTNAALGDFDKASFFMILSFMGYYLADQERV
jgi:hypothetical protein